MFGFLRSKRFWKRTAIGFAILVAALFIINGIMAWRVERRLENKLAEIRAAGDPASIADLAPEPIADDVNAAVKFRQITPRLKEFSKEHGKFFNTPIGKAYDETRDEGELPTAEQFAAIAAILDKYPDLDRDISELASYEQYASQADFSLDHQQFIEKNLEEIQEVRTVARFLDWRMQVLTAEGKTEQAVERGIELLRITRLYDSEPLLIHFLVAIAMRGIAVPALFDALAADTVSPDLHRRLNEELARHDKPHRLVRALKTERSLAIDGYMSLPIGAPKPSAWLFQIIGWPLKSLYVGALESFDDQITLAARPWHEIRAQFGLSDSATPSTGDGVLADLLIPALRAAHQANARNLAVIRSLRTYNQLRLYAEENDRAASGLGDLALPKEATTDPYTGEPLKLKLTDEGWIVYSVMENGVDDGGDFKDLKDYGVAPPAHRAH